MKVKEYKDITKNWRSFFAASGLNDEQISCSMSYIERLLKNGVPPIIDFSHLSKLVGIIPSELASMVNASSSYYRSFSIPKRSGGTRTISSPYPSLKFVQRWIYENILKNVKIHGCAHGFVNKRSILTNAEPHIASKCLLKIDLQDFFPSITLSEVIQVFRSLGYECHVAFYLASLCCCDNVLPQGAPTSPVISNIVAKHMDRRLYRLAKHFTLKYTRYADDIAFSGEYIPTAFLGYANTIIEDCGFVVNKNKIRRYGENGNKILTGISLSSNTPKLPRNYRRSLEQELYYIQKYGLNEHLRHIGVQKANYLDSIIGKVGYWLMIEPNNIFAKSCQEMLYDLRSNM